jgi:O-antigen ligase
VSFPSLTPRSTPAAALTRARGPRLAAFAATVVIGELLVGAVIAHSQFSLLVPIVGAMGLALAIRFPLATLCVAAFLGASVLPSSFVSVGGFGPVRPRGFELALGALLVMAVFLPRRRWTGGAAALLLTAFLALMGLSVALAHADSRADLSDLVNWVRPFGLLAFFYVVIRVVPDQRALRRLLAFCAAVGAFSGLVALALTLQPSLAHYIAGGKLVSVSDSYSANRVRVPGVALAYAFFWFAVLRTIATRGWRRAGWAAVIAGDVLNIGLSLNRNMWIGLAFGLALMLLLGGFQVRRRILAGLAVLTLAIGAIAVAPGESVGQRQIAPVLQRGATLLSPETEAQDPSVLSRKRETEIAWSVVQANPVFGIGPGVPFGVTFDEATGSSARAVVPQLFLHNQYLYLVLVAGFPAAVCFVGFLLLNLRRAWRPGARDPELVALGVGLASIMLSGIVMISFSVDFWTLTIGFLTGGIALRSHLRGQELSGRPG